MPLHKRFIHLLLSKILQSAYLLYICCVKTCETKIVKHLASPHSKLQKNKLYKEVCLCGCRIEI